LWVREAHPQKCLCHSLDGRKYLQTQFWEDAPPAGAHPPKIEKFVVFE